MNSLIDFKQETSEADIELYLSTNNCTVVKVYDNFELVYLVSSPTLPPVTDIVASVVNDSAAPITLLSETVVSNQYYNLTDPTKPMLSISTTDDKDWWKNYQLMEPDFAAPEVTINRKGAGANVYVMDSGLDTAHPEFAEAQFTNLFSFTGEFSDSNGHGTAISSVISGKTCGMTNARLKVVKVFDADQATKQSDLLNAFDAILGDYQANANGLGILNCSWSIPHNEYIEQKIRALIDAGIFVVVSAGNNGLPITNVTPASMPEVLTIGSYSKALTPSNFSNYTDPSVISYTAAPTNHGELDGWAPGEQIWVAVPGGTYGYSAGTSLAAAIHSCALAYSMSDDVVAGELLPFAQKQSLQYMSHRALNRKELLDMTDPKYATSAPVISTIIPHFQIPVEPPRNYANAATVGVPFIDRVFNAQSTKSAVLMAPLPEGFTLNANGLLYGTALSVTGSHHIYENSIEITTTEDEVFFITFKLGVVSEDYDRDLVPADDPIIKLTLETCPASCQNYCISNGYTGGGYCAGGKATAPTSCCACFNFDTGNNSTPCGT